MVSWLHLRKGHELENESVPSAEPEDKKLVRTIVNRIGGYRRYRLGKPVRLDFVSDSFCSMLGFGKRELADLVGGSYTALIHPDDIPAYETFIQKLSKEEGCESIGYRLIKRDGAALSVIDTMASIGLDDELTRGYSVVCRVSDDKGAESRDSGRKFAVLRVSDSASPRIEKMSGFAENLLSVGSGAEVPLLTDFVSLADREGVARALQRAHCDGHSEIGPCTIVSSFGEGVECSLWIERVGETGDQEVSSFIIKVEAISKHQDRRDQEALAFGRSFFTCLGENVFVLSRLDNTVTLVCQSNEAPTGLPLNIRMNADDFLDWLLGLVSPRDKCLVRKFMIDAKALASGRGSGDPDSSKLRFETSGENGLAPLGVLTMIPVSSTKCFLCFGVVSSPVPQLPAKASEKRIVARLFGSFSLSVGGSPVFIKHDKGRELLALLIERRGTFLTSRDAIALLWEREPDDVLRGRYRKAAFRLMEDLEKNGIAHIVESDHGARRIVPELIECDYYDYLDGLAEPSGDFLPEYTWSEYVRID